MNGLKRMLPEIFEYISSFKCIKHKEKKKKNVKSCDED